MHWRRKACFQSGRLFRVSHLQQELRSSSRPLAAHGPSQSSSHSAMGQRQPSAAPLSPLDPGMTRVGHCCAQGPQRGICRSPSSPPWLQWKVFHRLVAMTRGCSWDPPGATPGSGLGCHRPGGSLTSHCTPVALWAMDRQGCAGDKSVP